MAAITTPLVNFTNAINSDTFVPVAGVKSVEYIATPAGSVTGPVTSVYTLLFTLFDPNNTLGGVVIKINFSNSTDAQTALSDFLAGASTAI